VTPASVWRRYAAFLRRPPELVLTWHDRETPARAWLVINSLRGGAAGGGTRVRAGVGAREVTYLAKAMELKFSISGPAIGGAKTGIDFDPADARRSAVLERWYRAALPLLRDRYGTGGDLNVDEVLDVIPTFQRIGLRHPQEGVVHGHLRLSGAAADAVIERLHYGVEAPVAGTLAIPDCPFGIADVITGYGVAASLRRLYERRGTSLNGIRIMLEGFGNVGAAAGLYLTRYGAHVVGIRDAHHTLIDRAGIGAVEFEELVRCRENKLLPVDDARVRANTHDDYFWTARADVFISAAISESITADTLDRLGAAGVSVIACGSNQPFREAKLGSTRMAQAADARFTILPDILANCGMARTFSYLMQTDAQTRPEPIFEAVDSTIRDTLDEVLDRAADARTGLQAATVGLALDRIGG
jgi:glutamate dehydrogenase/leucine dehydrogenase